jgi:hypothetical protein
MEIGANRQREKAIPSIALLDENGRDDDLATIYRPVAELTEDATVAREEELDL